MAENQTAPKAEKIKKRKKCPTYIGGQAVLEGVMMMGKTCMATAVRDPDGEIQVEAKRLTRGKAAKTASKIPFVRGVVNLFSSLVRGTKTLMRSADVYGDEDSEEPGRFENWLANKFKISVMDLVTTISVFLGIMLAVGIFMVLPRLLVSLIPGLPLVWEYVMLAAIKLVIFIVYLGLILILKDIRRLYRYHGAEHKTINAYERGVELVPEKVKECSRIHDRCGTSFLFIVLIINIVLITLASWVLRIYLIENPVLKFFANLGAEVVLLPLIAGVAYEILKFFAKFDNKFVLIFKAPGMLLQKALTTREPDEEMLEVAIAAFKKVLEMDADPDAPESRFVTGGLLPKLLKQTKEDFAAAGIDGSDAEWIYALSLGMKRSELDKQRKVFSAESKRIDKIVKERLTGRPLWYIVGDTEFYGCTIKVDERALIPRPETELLADIVARSVEEGDRILDLCTGSGCIAVSVANACRDKKITVTASDISDASIMLAKENAAANNVNVHFVVSDLFERVYGRYNIIVCNPPYIKSGEIAHLQREVREHEPRIALDGGKDGLDFYRRLAEDIKGYIMRGGMLILECGEGQVPEILNIFSKREYAMIMKDLNGVERFVKIVF